MNIKKIEIHLFIFCLKEMKIVSNKLVSVSNLNLPSDCISVIMEFAFDSIIHYKQNIMSKIIHIFKNGQNRTHVFRHFYRVWNDADHDCFWMHVYVENKKQLILQNENCVNCGNYREAKCKAIICKCGFVELYEELL